MSFSKYPKILSLIIATLSITTALVSAKFEQTMLSINKDDKKVTFTLYHFDSSKTVILENVADNIGDTAAKNVSKAAISASNQASFTFQSGKFVFPSSTNCLIKNGAIVKTPTSLRSSKHSFILTDANGRHAICYSPSTTEAELGYAIKRYLAKSKTKFSTAVIINSGNQSGFYKTNGKYRPYYLKELKKPAKVLLVK